MNSNKKILITGANGFTGTALTDALRKYDYDVIGLTHHETSNPLFISADLTKKQELSTIISNINPDYVFHLASISSVDHNDTEAFYKTNLFGTLNLIEVLAKLKKIPKKVIIASSANVYSSANVGIIDESSPIMPTNHYANSKLAMEHAIKMWFNQLPITITRPFNYTGPGQSSKFLIPKIVSHFANKKSSITLGNLDIVREFSDIRFVTECYCKLLEAKNTDSQIYNICSGIGYSIMDIITKMQKIAGHSIEIIQSADLERKNEARTLIGSNEKLFNAIEKINIIKISETLENIYVNFNK